MAYDSLKALIRQYIKTNGEQEITGQILQNVLVEMVNQYPNTDGYATQSWVTSQLAGYLPLTGGTISGSITVNEGISTLSLNAHTISASSIYIAGSGVATQSWVTSQGYATTSQLADYLPLTGGTLSGNLHVFNASMSVFTAGSSATSYTATITGSGIEAQMLRSGTPTNSTNYRMVLNYGGLKFYFQDVAGTTITLSSVTSGSFIKNGGTSAQFLKADGSVDSNAYITASALSGYLPLTGGDLSGSLSIQSMMTLGSTTLHWEDEGEYCTLTFDHDGVELRAHGTGYFIANEFIKRNGTSAQFLKADGSVDSNAYITASALTGYATQSWVTSQGYATTSQLADYLPLTGGTLSGNLNVFNASMSVFTAGSSATSYTATITGSGIEAQMLRSGTPTNSTNYRMVLNYGGLKFYFQDVAGTTITLSSVTSGSFIKSGGTSAQFLKADGSVDSNAYITASALSGYLPLTGGTITGSITVNEGIDTLSLNAHTISASSIYIAGSGVATQSWVKGNLSVWNNVAMTWGTLTAANGYNIGIHASTSDGGDWGMCYKSGQISMQLDGWYYQNEGRYRVVDTSDLASYNPTANFKTINNQSIIGTGNINIEGGGGGAYYDAEIEYLESTGTQWIDTGYTSNNVDSFELVIVTNGTSGFMGSDGILQVDLTISAGLGKRTFKVTHSSNNGPNTYINGSLVRTQSFHTYNGYIITLFALGISSAAVSHYSSSRVYSAQLTINGTLVRDFIPVRVGQVGYMYDKVSGQLFGNSGTGSFVLGPDKDYLPLTGGTITGNLTVNGTYNSVANIKQGNSTAAYLHVTNVYADIDYVELHCSNLDNSRTNRPIVLQNGYGNVGIGVAQPAYKLHVNGTAGITGNLTVNGTLTASDGDLNIYSTGNSGGRGTIFDFKRHQDVYFNSAGEYFFYAALNAPAFNNTSDLRKKTIMGDVPMNLYNVANAPLFKFTWNDETKYSGQHIGSAAQYWQTVLPELVSIGRDADMTLAMQYDVIALASAITVAKTVVNHEERIILLERENEALKKEIADLKSA